MIEIILLGILVMFIAGCAVEEELPTTESAEPYIEGDKLIIENSYGTIVVQPHTNKGFLWHEQTVNFTWNLASNYLSFAFKLSPEQDAKWKAKGWNFGEIILM